MLQRITDLWPTLLRQGGAIVDEEQQSNLQGDGEDQESSDESGGLTVDEDQVLVDFNNLYWTRLMRIENYELEQDRKWQLGPDVVEECQAVA